ncbi:MAG: Rpn family recombination-promoting nuclease/putative transposase [Lachnospiraceae bacterium]|nr:Rpn family recombination-promoting nuclease/putative transposase [Lachnospiraceae bacterium]
MNDKRNMRRKPLREQNLMDDFLFDVATENLEACKIILELSLGIRIREIRWKGNQKVIHNLPGKRGIRLDFYVVDDQGRIYDVEMQKRNVGNIPKRTRFYQAIVDAPLLKSGEQGFDQLNRTYIVVICGFDLFGLGKYRYTFENRCLEALDLPIGDECTKIILNTKGTNDAEVEPALVDFLHYVENSTSDNIPEECDGRLKRLQQIIEEIKDSEKMEVELMTMEERDRLIREEGRSEGRSEGQTEGKLLTFIELVCKKLAKGKSLEQIAVELEEDPSTIQQICDIAAGLAPDCDAYDILNKLLEEA